MFDVTGAALASAASHNKAGKAARVRAAALLILRLLPDLATRSGAGVAGRRRASRNRARRSALPFPAFSESKSHAIGSGRNGVSEFRGVARAAEREARTRRENAFRTSGTLVQ